MIPNCGNFCQRIAGGVLFLTFAMVVYLTVANYLDRSEIHGLRPPVEVHAAWFGEDMVMPGQHATLFVDRTRNRYCPGLVIQVWHKEGSNKFAQQPMVSTLADPTVGRVIDELIKTAPDVEPDGGKWCYDPGLLYMCPRGLIAVKQPRACLRIGKGKGAG